MTENRDTSLQDLIKKVLNKYNSLPESIINPLMIGVLFVGIGATVFNPGTVVYLAMVFGASAGMAYAASKNQTAQMPLPTWAITSIGVASAVIYGVAGIPGLMLTAGVSGGWYLNSYFSDRFQQWKTDFQNFLTKFKNNPVRQSIHLTFNGLQFLADMLTPVEEKPAPAPAKHAQQPVATPKPDTAVIRFRGNPVLTTPRKEIKIDFAKSYGLPGLLKALLYSLNPMNDLVDINKDKNKDKDKKDNITVQTKAILAITDNTLLEQPTPVIFQPATNARPKIAILPTIVESEAEAEINSLSVPNSSPVLLSEPVRHLHPALSTPVMMPEADVNLTPPSHSPVLMPEPVVRSIQTPEATPVEAGTRTENSTPQTCAIGRKNSDPVLFYQLPRGMRFFENMINESVFSDYRRRI